MKHPIAGHLHLAVPAYQALADWPVRQELPPEPRQIPQLYPCDGFDDVSRSCGV